MIQSGGFVGEASFAEGRTMYQEIVFRNLTNQITEELEGCFLAPLDLRIFVRVIGVSVYGTLSLSLSLSDLTWRVTWYRKNSNCLERMH
jgi:hypothetical protein